MTFRLLRPVLPVALPLLLACPPAPGADARLVDAFSAGAGRWTLTAPDPRDLAWTRDGEQVYVTPTAEPVLATYTVPAGAAGFYAIADSSFRRETSMPGTIVLQVSVRRAGGAKEKQPAPVVVATLGAGELFDFDAFLGYLAAGDAVQVSIDGDGDPSGDRSAIDFRLERLPSIPVSAFPADRGAWTRLQGVSPDPVARHLAWSDAPAPDAPLTFSGDDAATVLALRAPQSGYYALDDARVTVTGGAVRARIYLNQEEAPRRELVAESTGEATSFDTDIGYVAKGRTIWIAFAGTPGTTATFSGTLVEWAPRRPPLRVRRTDRGEIEVITPEHPRRAINIPAARWITVPAPAEGVDATEAIREAIARASAQPREEDEFAGVRLERGRTYTVATQQNGGTIFTLGPDARRLVLDGDGATLRVASPELTRRDIELFTVNGGRDLVFHDMVVTATSLPFTTGEILDVGPRGEDTQTVTFRVDSDALDPLADISRDGRNNAYAYDPEIPGRLALGTWTHYPGDGAPSIRATDTPGVFTHRVRRTGDSIDPGGKWLIKNKRAGVVYLTTRAGAENITLSAIDGRASGGGALRFWQTSGVNILDCTFEPEGGNWISSSADGVHGRGREGVWIENTLMRGICEDVMNTYGQNMIVLPDDDAADAEMSIRMFNRSSESFDDGAMPLPRAENVVVGDQLVFFNPNSGRVLGHAQVRAIVGGRFTLSHPVPDVDPWNEGDGKTATMVYNTRIAGRFFVRDSRLMDSMRFGIYIKARGGVVFGTQFEGLSGPSIFAVNEPEWPEGPPATHLWVQGCTFSQNNFGFMPRHRDFMVVDPADISVYTRRFRDPAEPDDHRAHLTHGQFANSHLKFIGNVFHDWRGMGISVRNARNVRIEDNLFLPPVNDDVMRATLAQDPALNVQGRGAYAAVHLDSADGVRVRGNRFVGLAGADHEIVQNQDVTGLERADNHAEPGSVAPVVALSFSEWFGATSTEAAGIGASRDVVRLGSAMHRAGRLGGGLVFAGGMPATLTGSRDTAMASREGFGLAVWARPAVAHAGQQSLVALGDTRQGLLIGIERGRWFARVTFNGVTNQLDLGAAVDGRWQHLALSCDAARGHLRGFVDGLEVATARDGVPANAALPGTDVVLGERYHGMLDEFRIYPAAITRGEMASLALQWVPTEP